MKSRQCNDGNPKTVLRKFDWDGEYVEISLCEQHCKDPDFSHYIYEITL